MALDKLATYRAKRDFQRTAEPRGTRAAAGKALRFVVQKHDATRLHFDLRLEVDGVFKSWAVPKGPSLDPRERRLAVEVEDHPLDYGSFEGTIPAGEYGGGTVQLWDRGRFTPHAPEGAAGALRRGKLKFDVAGERMVGGWTLVRMRDRAGERKPGKNWLLIKEQDDAARTGKAAEIGAIDRSVTTGRTLAEIAAGKRLGRKVWHSDRTAAAAGARRKKKRNGDDDAARLAPASRGAKTPPASPPRGKSIVRLPAFIPPQLATLADQPPLGENWVHEVKFDGYRIQLRIEAGEAQARSRNGLDWSDRFAELVAAARRLPDAIIDGEVVALSARGNPDFSALQDALSVGSTGKLVYFAFDLLFAGGRDLRGAPLGERKAALRRLLKDSPRIRYVDHFASAGAAVLSSACRMQLEGIVSKRLDAPYASGRGGAWLKTKCRGREEFVIGGWTGGKRGDFGALVVGTFDGKALRYRGRVGTGFSARNLPALGRALAPLAAKASPFAGRQPDRGREIRWVEPRLVAELEFGGWTADGLLRHAAFKGLRDDKTARDVVAEGAVKPSAPRARRAKRGSLGKAAAPAGGFAISNRDKLLWPEDRISKGQLADYYERVAGELLRFVAGRPLSILRAPDGLGGQLFFQRHLMPGMSAAVRGVRVAGADKPYIVIDDVAGLAGLAQFAAVELHPWGARADDVERPDMITIDLDPDDGLPFPRLLRATLAVRERLESLGLATFPKLTGGKGLHVVVPLKPSAPWPEVKAFARTLVEAMADAAPEHYTTSARKAGRKGRIFLDYLRNDRTATAIAAWSPRARRGAPISVPVSWRWLERRRERPVFSLTDLAAVRRIADPWEGFERGRAALRAAAGRS